MIRSTLEIAKTMILNEQGPSNLVIWHMEEQFSQWAKHQVKSTQPKGKGFFVVWYCPDHYRTVLLWLTMVVATLGKSDKPASVSSTPPDTRYGIYADKV
jgi:hypothetical protein